MLGFSPHSGWAVVVVVGGDGAEPRVLSRARVEMADPRLTGSRQPYHEVERMPPAQAERRLERFSETARDMAHDAIRALVEEVRTRECHLDTAGILDSAGRKGGSLAAILASHALIHTADGDHFRDALADACGRCGLAVVRVRQRDLSGRAAAVLRRSADSLQGTVKSLGKPLGPPWGADEKSATLLGWLLLAETPVERRPR